MGNRIGGAMVERIHDNFNIRKDYAEDVLILMLLRVDQYNPKHKRLEPGDPAFELTNYLKNGDKTLREVNEEFSLGVPDYILKEANGNEANRGGE